MTPEERRQRNREATQRYRQKHPGRAYESTRKHLDGLSLEKLAEVKAREAAYRKENAEYLKALTRKWKDRNQERERHREHMLTVRRARKAEASASRPRPERCELCGQAETVKTKFEVVRKLSLDHCHNTGRFRGWLCARCNMMLGKVNDDAVLLQKMASYVLSGGVPS